MKTILLRFSGPLQSWGIGSHFETRQTERYPSKSAIIGMIAACLGYRRGEDSKIQQLNDLDFAVRVDQPGNILRDYHTVAKYNKKGIKERTYVTQRYYLEDAVFVVAIGSDDHATIDKIEQAVKSPYFQPYMGRRSLPLPANFVIKTTLYGVIDSLETLGWQAAKWYQKKQIRHLDIYCDSYLLKNHSKWMVRDVVRSFSYKERLYGFRAVSKLEIDVDKMVRKVEHDAFGELGG